MTPLEAADYLRRRVRDDKDAKLMVVVAIERSGYDDLFDWADQRPDEVIMLAESLEDTDAQFRNMAGRLETGDLS